VPEVVKFVGGLLAVIGIALLFVSPVLGLLVLALVGVLGVVSGIKTREKRHAELLEATQHPVKQRPVEPPATSASNVIKERLSELEQLRSDGLVSDDEYETKRQEILDSL